MDIPNVSLIIDLADKRTYDMYRHWLADPTCPMAEWKRAWVGIQQLLKQHPEWDPDLAKALNNPERKQ